MENIFKNAYFGKAYKTRGGDKGIVIEIFDDCVCLALENLGSHLLYYYKNGVKIGENSLEHLNIDSEWTEEINEEKIEKLAEEYFLNTYNKGITDPNLDIINEKKYAVADYKAGYRKALEKLNN